MTCKLKKTTDSLLFIYQPDTDDGEWVEDSLKEKGEVYFKRTFYFEKQDRMVNSDSNGSGEYAFILGRRFDSYYCIDSRKLSTGYSVYIYSDLKPETKWFVSERNVSHFKAIFKVVTEDFYIDGDQENAIPLQEFLSLVNRFPRSTWELDRYVDARIEAITAEYFQVIGGSQERYEAYLEKKVTDKSTNAFIAGDALPMHLKESRLNLYKGSLSILQSLLKRGEQYSESIFQKHLIDLLCLVFPQYILAIPKVKIPDAINNKMREPDFLLVDVNGNVDVLEIKKAFQGSKVIRDAKYRDNYLPARELSGAVMQVEKYIHYLRSWGTKGEAALTKKYESLLPKGVCIRFLKTKGMVFIGEGKLDTAKQQDFDLIRRQYEDIMDILTYEDLVRRLEKIIKAIESGV